VSSWMRQGRIRAASPRQSFAPCGVESCSAHFVSFSLPLRASFPRRLRNSLCEACRAPVPRRPQQSSPLPRGHQRCDAPSAATERPCAARLWESRRRHERCVRRRVPAPPSDGRERERNLVERARPRSLGPRAREDGADRTLAPWWSERVRAAMGPRAREDGVGFP
jgi:hypothetical protein